MQLLFLAITFLCLLTPSFAIDHKVNQANNCTTNEYDCILYESRVHYIDRFPIGEHFNYLFRGNMPKNSSNEFAYEELQQFMTAKAKLENVTLPSTYYLVDISFLVFVEEADLEIEQNFFQTYPELGEVVNLPLMGMCNSPQGIPDRVLGPMAESLASWTWDKLPYLVTLLRTYLETPQENSIVIYIHCEAGKDRTGEVSGAYYLQYLKWGFNETIQYDYNSSPVRQISPDMLNGLQWFCYFLQFHLNYDLDCSL